MIAWNQVDMHCGIYELTLHITRVEEGKSDYSRQSRYRSHELLTRQERIAPIWLISAAMMGMNHWQKTSMILSVLLR